MHYIKLFFKEYDKIIKNFTYNLSYQILSLILPFITIPYITHIFTQETIGINTVIQANCSYFVLFGMLGINLLGPREIAKYQGDKEKLSSRFFSIYKIQIISHLIALVGYILFVLFYMNNQLGYYYTLYIFSSAFDISWFYIGMENFKSISFKNIFIRLLSFFLLFVLVKNEQDIYLYICTLYIPQIVINAYMWTILLNKFVSLNLYGLIDRSDIREALSLFFPQIASSIYTILDKTILGVFSTYTSVAIYEQGQTLLRLFLAIIPTFSKVMLPRISNCIQNGENEETLKYMKMSTELIGCLSFLLFWGVLSCSQLFVDWYLPHEYKQAGTVIRLCAPIILAVSGSNLIAVQFLIPMGEQRKYSKTIFIAAVVNIVFNLILTPFWGIYGVCIGSIIAEVVGFSLQLFYAKRYLDIKKLFSHMPMYAFSGCLMSLVLYQLTRLIASTFLNLLLMVAIGSFLYFGLIWVLFKIHKCVIK